MEIDITAYVNDIDCSLFSDSISNSGLENISKITWNNAMQHVAVSGLVELPSELQACRDWFSEFGAWTRKEIDSWSDQKINAVLLQFIASSVKEIGAYDTYAEYCEYDGACHQDADGTWWFYVGL